MQSASGARACAHALGKRRSVVALFASPSLGQAAVNGVPGLRRIAGAPHRLPCGQRARAPAAPWGRHALPLPWSAAPPQPPPIRSVNVLQLVCMSGSDAASSAAPKAFVRYPITGDGSCMFRACAQVRAVVAAVVAVAAVLLCLANPASGSHCCKLLHCSQLHLPPTPPCSSLYCIPTPIQCVNACLPQGYHLATHGSSATPLTVAAEYEAAQALRAAVVDALQANRE